MSNNQSNIQISFLNESTVEDFLVSLFNPSKNKLKKNFDKKFLAKNIFAKKSVEFPIDFVNDGLINPNYLGPEIKIINEDENFLVLDKPSSIHVHPLKYDESDNCLSFMRSKNLKGLEVNCREYDRGLLYRLDFETSGVLVYVKNEGLYHELRSNFENIAKEKIYYARVTGRCEVTGVVEHHLIPTMKNGSKMKAMAHAENDSKLATLEILQNDYDANSDTTLVMIKLKTGHRHQIRVQLSALSYPIIGDTLYGGILDVRLKLHAYKYVLTCSKGEFTYQAELINF